MRTFPKDFIWGTATASYQIEGAVQEDGRGPTIWDTFAHTPGKIHNGDHGDIACDHYHRWQEDIALMQALNLNGYRFSLAWSRILPQGRGAVNQKGLDFYSRLVDGLLAAGITPFVTLYHWDLPQALQDDGMGWQRRSIVDDYVAYADVVSRALGDRVKHWITLNEPFIFSVLGHLLGTMAPGVQDMPNVTLTVAHHALLAHGKAVPVLRANVPGAVVGTTMYLQQLEAASDSPADVAAAARADGFVNRWFLDPLFKGSYPQDLAETFAYFMPPIQPGDLEAIRAPLDFLGVNFYERRVVKEGDEQPFLNFSYVKTDLPRTAFDWEINPDALYNILMRVHKDYAPTAIYITESGACFDDVLQGDAVHDAPRVDYLRGYFAAALRAVEAGVPLKGYFVWSLLDNFEWAEGYSKRFGIVYVDYATQRRIVKDSGRYMAEAIARRAP
ncbi:MAG: beta-glucosidase [Chloroflexi bacterium]|nr:beta-glucosidase [Chloroflexota bacterium]